MAKKRKSAFDPDQVWADGAEFVPNPGAPAVKEPKRGRLLYIWVMSAAFAFPLMLGLNLLLINEIISAPSATSVTAQTSASRPAATLALHRWLAGEPSPIPAAEILAWQSVLEVPPGPVKSGTTDAVRPVVEIHTFAVASGTALLTVDVTTSTIGGVSVAVGTPALAAGMPFTESQGEEPLWGDFVPATVSEEAQEAVRTWSQALLSGDGVKLRLAVSDPSLDHTYFPLAGLSWMGSGVGAAVTLTPASSTDEPDHSVIVAAATVSFLAGEPVENSDASATMRFDVRIEAANTASPVVVAWGPTGSGPTLTSHSNAITTLAEVEIATPEPIAPEPSEPASPDLTQTDADPASDEGS